MLGRFDRVELRLCVCCVLLCLLRYDFLSRFEILRDFSKSLNFRLFRKLNGIIKVILECTKKVNDGWGVFLFFTYEKFEEI